MTEPYLPRAGDTVALTGTVKFDFEANDAYLHVTIKDPAGFDREVAVSLDSVEVTSRRWLPGDDVALDAGEWLGTVIATNGEWVWVEHPNGSPGTYLANVLSLHSERPSVGPDGEAEAKS